MLPVKEPERLLELGPFVASINARGERYTFSYPLFKEVRDRSLSVSSVFAALDGTRTMDLIQPRRDRQTEEAEVQLVSGEYFQVLAVNAITGRILTPEDNKIAGANAVAVIGYGFWKQQICAGLFRHRKTKHADLPFTIVGVTSLEFFGESVGRAPDIWVPLTMQPALDRSMSYLEGMWHGCESWLGSISLTTASLLPTFPSPQRFQKRTSRGSLTPAPVMTHCRSTR